MDVIFFCIIILEWSKWTKENKGILEKKSQSKITYSKTFMLHWFRQLRFKMMQGRIQWFYFRMQWRICNFKQTNNWIEYSYVTCLNWLFFAPPSRIHKEKIKYWLRYFIFIVCDVNNLHQHITALHINSMNNEVDWRQ